MNLPFDQDEEERHRLLVLIGVPGVLELQPELLASSFVDLAEHLLYDLLVASELL